ncbi:MAG: hypothetical protein KDB10_01630 [Acidimicrobiales bacterium]|nr:hypothetical protein [Acidimicrobiales bacterium]MCB9373447.1 hypothetical protein [Microthrixaceae bacterium]
MTGITATRPDRRSLPPVRPAHVLVLGLAVLAVVLVLRLLVPLLEGPGRVDQIVVSNPTDYEVSVRVGEAGRDSRTPMGTVDAHEEVTVERVVDQGDAWVFTFTAQGRAAGELERTRDQLEADGWQIVIPSTVGDQLEAEGVPVPEPPPTTTG